VYKKKPLLIFLLSVLVSANVYSLPELKTSAGVGINLTGDLGGGYIYFGGYNTASYYGLGVFSFFDLTFVEVNLGIFMASGYWKSNSESDTGGTIPLLPGLDIGLLVKYPFKMKNDSFSVFPLLGISNRVLLGFSKTRWDEKYHFQDVDYNVFWFKFGGGFDFSKTDIIYLRINILYGFRLENKWEREEKKWDIYNYYHYLLGHGFDIRFAFGFRL